MQYQSLSLAVYQNLNLVRENEPEVVAVFGSDHVYRMDVRQMLTFHRDRAAVVTVAATSVPLNRGRHLGIIAADSDGRIRGFQEKPQAGLAATAQARLLEYKRILGVV